MLAEIHENYIIQQKMVDHDYWVYDFALPMLLLHGLMSGRTDRLIHWLNICPHHQFTTWTPTTASAWWTWPACWRKTRSSWCAKTWKSSLRKPGNTSSCPAPSRPTAKKVRRYQLGTTYYSALDCDDDAYLLARAVQFFTPGIPQVYYVGLLAGENDIENLKNGGEPRSINRHNYSEAEIDQVAEKPVVQKLCNLMRFRNQHPAFNGDITVDQDSTGGKLHIRWDKDGAFAALDANFRTSPSRSPTPTWKPAKPRPWLCNLKQSP